MLIELADRISEWNSGLLDILGPLTEFGAADWEFTYDDSDGDRRHVNNRGFITSPHQAYGMWWSTLDRDWAANRPNLELIERSFTPAV